MLARPQVGDEAADGALDGCREDPPLDGVIEGRLPCEYAVYQPGTLRVSESFAARGEAIEFARKEWPDLPIIIVRVFLIFQGAPFIEAA